MGKTYTMDGVKKHNKEDDCWVVVDNKVYDVTHFLDEHPGGKKILLQKGGTDATEEFEMFHDFESVQPFIDEFSMYIGDLAPPSKL